MRCTKAGTGTFVAGIALSVEVGKIASIGVGANVGANVRGSVGTRVGTSVGNAVGDTVGETVKGATGVAVWVGDSTVLAACVVAVGRRGIRVLVEVAVTTSGVPVV